MLRRTAEETIAEELARGEVRFTRRGLMVHDGLIFLALLAVSVVLFTATWFLFRSFETHREDLGERWSQRGRLALAQRRPQEAVAALRAALSYKPGDRSYEMLLAESLAASGKRDEATSYFLNLRETQPGDGFTNLQLARLARQRGDWRAAVDFYQAAIFGDWQGNAPENRRAARLELAQYLLERKDWNGARTELMILASNAEEDEVPLLVRLGDLLVKAGDEPDALALYERAVKAEPKSRRALERAGMASFATGDYAGARRLLARAATAKDDGSEETAPDSELEAQEHMAERMMELSLSRELDASERARHLAAAGAIAQRRLAACVAQSGGAAPPLLELVTKWQGADAPALRRSLQTDAATQDAVMGLVFETETTTATACGASTGDDAVLLRMAQAARGGTE